MVQMDGAHVQERWVCACMHVCGTGVRCVWYRCEVCVVQMDSAGV